MSAANDGQLFDAVRHFLAAEEWPAQEMVSEGCLLLRFGGDNGKWRCVVRVREEEGQVIFYSYAPVEVPPQRFGAVLDLLNRANFGLFVGNFELQPANGTIQFRTSIDVEGEPEKLGDELLKHIVYQNVLTMDRYLPAIEAVAEGRTSPEAAIAAVEAT